MAWKGSGQSLEEAETKKCRMGSGGRHMGGPSRKGRRAQ